MPNVFRSISDSEYEQLLDAVPLVAILVGAADDNFDSVEKEWAKKIVHIRSFAYDAGLRPFYKDLDSVFESRLSEIWKSLPVKTADRNKIIVDRLSALNSVLPRLNPMIASALYEGLLDFAEQVARASGGFLRMLSVSYDESEWLGLPMLDPVFPLDEEE